MMARQEGVELGPYRIIEQIGLGGMATVYKAYQPAMERYVALKVLPDHYARDPKFVQRFVQEAKTIARLEHNHILPVFDYGEQDRVAYLAMRYLDGGTLKDVLGLGKLTLADAAELMAQIGSALDYAHRQGVVHRDVKPSNIMVDSEGAAYLTDFGIAKVLEGNMELTATGGLVGTPAYMAPEQALGKKVDRRADIYALGVILYEMVTGSVPFQADTPMAVALAHVHAPLPLPRQLNADIPEEVEQVVLKALAKNPDDRYQAASDLASAFKQAVASQSDGFERRLPALAAEAREAHASQIATYDVPSGLAGRFQSITARRGVQRGVAVSLPLLALGALAIVGVGVALVVALGGSLARVGGLSQDEAIAYTGGLTQTAVSAKWATATQSRFVVNMTATQVALNRPLTQTVVALTPSATLRPIDNAFVVGDCDQNAVCLWSVTTGAQLGQVRFESIGIMANVVVAPDGQKVAFWGCTTENFQQGGPQHRCLDEDIYIGDLATGEAFGVYTDGLYAGNPAWSSDGQRIAFTANGGLGIVNVDGTGFTTILNSPGTYCPVRMTWSPDSQAIAALAGNCTTGLNVISRYVIAVNADGSNFRVLFDLSDRQAHNVAWSPDGKSVAVAVEGVGAGREYVSAIVLSADCDISQSGCNPADTTPVTSVSMGWFPEVFPRWVGETIAP